MINEDRSAFVMGEIQFRFVGPAAYGDKVECTLTLIEVRDKTVLWHCNAINQKTGQQITEGKQPGFMPRSWMTVTCDRDTFQTTFVRR